MIIISIIYMIIPLSILFFSADSVIFRLFGNNGSGSLALLGAAAGGLLIFIIVTFLFGLFATKGLIHFARTGAMGEALNTGEILATIGKIEWINYIVSLIVIWIIIGLIEVILMMNTVIGAIILFILTPFLTIISNRYLSLLYDEGV